MPGFVIEPSLRLTNLLPAFAGSLFGIIHGLTQRGVTGTIPFGANAPELEGLNTSAVAVARTVFVARDQIRESKVGRLARVTCTVTSGLTPNRSSPGTAVQSAIPAPD